MNDLSSADSFGVLRRELRDTRALAANMDHKLRQVLDDRHRSGSLVELLWKGLAARVGAYSQRPSADVDDAIAHLRKSADYMRLEMVTRATTSPAMTGTATWAAELIKPLVIEFIDQLQPSIFSQLFAPGAATNIPIPTGAGDIKIPARSAAGGAPTLHGAFTSEGNPIAVRKSSLAQITLAPKKLGVITSYSDEMANYSVQALEPLLQMLITGDTQTAVDAILLDATAGSATRPAGLRFNATVVTPSAATPATAAMTADIGNLIAAISPATRIAILINPKQAAALSFAAAVPSFTLMAAATVPVGRVIAVDLDSLLAASWGAPLFEVTNSATIHEDDVPLPLGTPGAPATVAAPMRSLFQSDASAIRMTWRICWATTRTTAVAVTDPVIW